MKLTTKFLLSLTCLILLTSISLSASDNKIVSFEEFMELDDHIRKEIRSHVSPSMTPKYRLIEIIDYIFDEEGINYTYDKYKNLTARETFYQKSGNCLSFACLIVTLGREVGLNVRFNNMQKPLTLQIDGNLLLDIKHVNAVLVSQGDYEVVELNKFYREYMFKDVDIISDNEAYLFYLNNMGVFSIRDGNMDLGFEYFNIALEKDKSHASSWKNLGSYYNCMGNEEKAEECYYAAFKINKRDPVTSFYLGKIYQSKGQHKKAQSFMKRGRKYMSKNPYNFFVMGNNALSDGKAEDAIRHYRQAIKLDDECHYFYYHLAMAYAALEEFENMRVSLQNAYDCSNEFSDRLQYSRLLNQVDNENTIITLQQQFSNN